jgi:hypothetical protein
MNQEQESHHMNQEQEFHHMNQEQEPQHFSQVIFLFLGLNFFFILYKHINFEVKTHVSFKIMNYFMQ